MDMDPDESDNNADALERSKSTRSVAETLPWYRELLFVAVICLAQLYTRKSNTPTYPIHIHTADSMADPF